MSHPKSLFLVDGSHYDRLRSVFGVPFDLHKLACAANEGRFVDLAVYYRDVRDPTEAERQHPLFGWLQHNGFKVKGRTHGPDEPRERYGTNLVQMAVDALALTKPGEHVILVAGDVKLEPVLGMLRHNGIRTSLISTLDASDTIAPPALLTNAADTFVDLSGLIQHLALDNEPRRTKT